MFCPRVQPWELSPWVVDDLDPSLRSTYYRTRQLTSPQSHSKPKEKHPVTVKFHQRREALIRRLDQKKEKEAHKRIFFPPSIDERVNDFAFRKSFARKSKLDCNTLSSSSHAKEERQLISVCSMQVMETEEEGFIKTKKSLSRKADLFMKNHLPKSVNSEKRYTSIIQSQHYPPANEATRKRNSFLQQLALILSRKETCPRVTSSLNFQMATESSKLPKSRSRQEKFLLLPRLQTVQWPK